MNPKQWNAAMFSAMLALAVIAVPFFATADGFGDLGDGIGDILGGLGDLNGNPGDVGDSVGDLGSSFGDIGGGLGGFGSGIGDIGGWDPFDDDLGPFDPIPGNPPGDDTVRPPETHWPPVVPPVVTPETSPVTPSSDSEDSLQIFIHNIFVNNPYDELPGNQVPLMITFQNKGTKDLENTKVIVMIPDLSARATVGPFDLGADERITSTVFIDLPEDTELGVYPVRLQVYNEDAQRIVHREIEVIDYS
jgi:hypothetical protein